MKGRQSLREKFELRFLNNQYSSLLLNDLPVGRSSRKEDCFIRRSGSLIFANEKVEAAAESSDLPTILTNLSHFLRTID